eukprot:gene9902-13322_t
MLPRVSRRLFSSKAVSHAPPIKIHGINGRYASAVYVAASKINGLAKVENELLAFKDIVNKSPNFAAFLANPTIPRREKYAKVGEIFDESKFSHISRNFFLTLAANGRIGDSLKIVDAYGELMNASRGAIKVTIISAESLKKKHLDQIEAGVMKLVGEGKS